MPLAGAHLKILDAFWCESCLKELRRQVEHAFS